MRALLLLILIAGVVVGVVGFNQGWFTVATRNKDGKTEVIGTVDPVKIEQDRKTFLEKAEKQVQELDAAIERLKGKAKEAGAKAQPQVDAAVADLRTKRDQAAKRLEELRQASAERWHEFRADAETALEDLRKGISSAASRFE